MVLAADGANKVSYRSRERRTLARGPLAALLPGAVRQFRRDVACRLGRFRTRNGHYSRSRFIASRALARSSSVVQPRRSASSSKSCCKSCGRRRRDGVGRPGEARAAVFQRHAPRDRGIAIEHLGRHRSLAHLRERLAKAVLARIEQIADPPRPGPLAPERELQRTFPLGQLGLAADPHAHRREMERSDGNFGRHGEDQGRNEFRQDNEDSTD